MAFARLSQISAYIVSKQDTDDYAAKNQSSGMDLVQALKVGLTSSFSQGKTGSAGLTSTRIAQIKDQVRSLAIPNVPIFGIKP